MNKTGKTWSLALLGLAFGVILSSCSQVMPNLMLETQAIDLVGLNGKKLFAYAQTNCPIDQFDIPGQGYRARGSTGGLAVLDPPYDAMPTAITSPGVVGTDVYNLAALSALSRNVTILVVDDFNGDTTVAPVRPPVYKLGPDVFNLPSRGFSTVLGRRLSELDAEVSRLEATNQIAHGTLVMNHINALILGTGQYSTADRDIRDGKVSFKNMTTGRFIRVWAVDTEDLDTETITPRMYTALFSALETHKQIVVNMSFSIVPCTMRDDFAANRSRYPTFQSYALAIADANEALRGGTDITLFRNRVRKQLTTPFDNDPLHEVIQSANLTGQLGSTGNLIYVSSAGNFGLGYSMSPANWPEVVSASSNDTGSGRSVFSNKGEVMVTGAWYTLTDPANINGVGFSQDKVAYAGTSFSSPALAVFSAFDIARSTPKCKMELDAVGTPIPDIAHPLFDDKPLADAIPAYCT
jgi:Subtilase family